LGLDYTSGIKELKHCFSDYIKKCETASARTDAVLFMFIVVNGIVITHRVQTIKGGRYYENNYRDGNLWNLSLEFSQAWLQQTTVSTDLKNQANIYWLQMKNNVKN
jgi:hypothetical protein